MNSSRFVLVTGAAGGIGGGLLRALSKAGWSVLATDHPLTESSINHDFCREWIFTDLNSLSRDEDSLSTFRKNVFSITGQTGLSAIVHNAALQRLASFDELKLSDWNDTLNVNLIAPIVISRAFIDSLQANQGSIVHIGSIHSQLTKPGFTAYATSKAAVAGLTRAMAVDLGGRVRVNAIEPAAIATPMLEAGFADNPELRAQLEAFHPTGSIGSPDDVARALLFLLDPANSFINGCVFPLGGGIHSRLHDPS